MAREQGPRFRLSVVLTVETVSPRVELFVGDPVLLRQVKVPPDCFNDRRRLFVSLVMALRGVGNQSAIYVPDKHPFGTFAPPLVFYDPVFLEPLAKIAILQRLFHYGRWRGWEALRKNSLTCLKAFNGS